MNLGEGEYGNLTVPSLLFLGIEVEDALLLKRSAENNLGSNVGKGEACCLRKEGYCSRGSGIYLDDVNVIVLVNDELDVEETNDADLNTKLLCIGKDLALNLIRNGVRRVNGNTVTGVNTRSFNKLHNTCNEYVASVANCVNLNLLTLDVVVNENGTILVNFNRLTKVSAKLLFVTYKLHCSTAKHEAGANENGIANLCSNSYAVLNFCNRLTLWLGNAESRENLFKGISVLRSVNSGSVCADNFNTSLRKRLCKVNCSLSTERCNYAKRLLELDNAHNVLCCKGLKVELVRSSIVGRNCLGVIVDNDRLVSAGSDGVHCVNCRIVELNALTDTDRTCAKNENLFSVEELNLALACVGGVEVRNVCACVRSINHAEGRSNSKLVTEVVYLNFTHAHKLCNVLI